MLLSMLQFAELSFGKQMVVWLLTKLMILQVKWLALVVLPFLLSAAAEDKDPCIEAHLFFSKTAGYGCPGPSSQGHFHPPINPLPVASHQMTNKGKQPAHRTCRSREDSPDADKGHKRRRVSKAMSKALLTDTEDQDQDQLPGPVIVLPKRSKTIEPAPVAPPKSKGSTQGVKKQSKVTIGPMPDKGKGKAKAAKIADIAERPMFMTHPARAYQGLLQVPQDEGAVQLTSISHISPAAHPHSPEIQGHIGLQAQGMLKECQTTPILESEEEAVKDTDASVPTAEAADIKADVDARKPADIDAEMQDVVTGNQPDPIALADDFPADHWLEPTSDDMPLGIPSPTPAADHISLPLASLLPTISNVHECVLALAAQDALARVDAMERDFKTCMLPMRAEFSQMQQDVGHTVTVVDGLVGLVEKLRQAHCQQSILPSTDHQQPWSYCGHHAGASLGHGVFEWSVWSFASHPFGCLDVQGTTFMSSQAASVSALASPSLAPPQVGPCSALSLPPSAAQSVP
ncbi:uncharacterized protein BJ212DRAFT_1298313 [Suillus subaureus]|uniref:Uncharacterized protein n=1 Tax=Suillus subaureus TaxID=48587 RepID=A0A9P7EEH0_9AGAM|nr:uncharacterized protein BJ212DRAFT_1298313 [Suillus subaureus]KAG1819021.1 hypothetical protein BJ212DRAFT_1298313 [Suillus subaureus]